MEYFGFKNILRFSKETTRFFGYVCTKSLWFCKTVISWIVENEATDQIDYGALHNLYYHQPGGTSTRNLIHWMQIIGAENIRYYDYGSFENLQIYNRTVPPQYDLKKLEEITFDIFITSSDGDPYCLREDFERMLTTFKKAKVTTKHLGKYNHLDYLWGKNAHIDIYEEIVKFLEN